MLAETYKKSNTWERFAIIASIVIGVVSFFVETKFAFDKSYNALFSCGSVPAFSFAWFHSWVLIGLFCLTMSISGFVGGALALFVSLVYIPKIVHSVASFAWRKITKQPNPNRDSDKELWRRNKRLRKFILEEFCPPPRPTYVPVKYIYVLLMHLRDCIVPAAYILIVGGFLSVLVVLGNMNKCLVAGPSAYYVASLVVPTLVFAIALFIGAYVTRLIHRVPAFFVRLVVSRIVRCSFSDASALYSKWGSGLDTTYASPGQNLKTGKAITIGRKLHEITAFERRLLRSLDEQSRLLDRIREAYAPITSSEFCASISERVKPTRAVLLSGSGSVSLEFFIHEEAAGLNSFVAALRADISTHMIEFCLRRSPSDIGVLAYQTPISELFNLDNSYFKLVLPRSLTMIETSEYAVVLYNALRAQMVVNDEGKYSFNQDFLDTLARKLN